MAGREAAVTFKEVRESGTQPWTLNNTALKDIRDSNENPRGTPNTERVELFGSDPFDVRTLTRSKGTDYELGEPLQPWSWRRMLNGMSDTTLTRVVGPGITNICCMPIPNSYDHKRRHAALQPGTKQEPFPKDAPVPIWDFVVWRSDGTAVRLHPSQTQKKIAIMDYASQGFDRNGPKAGKGKSDGRGTYKAMLAGSYTEKGSFGPDKQPALEDVPLPQPGAPASSSDVIETGAEQKQVTEGQGAGNVAEGQSWKSQWQGQWWKRQWWKNDSRGGGDWKADSSWSSRGFEGLD